MDSEFAVRSTGAQVDLDKQSKYPIVENYQDGRGATELGNK